MKEKKGMKEGMKKGSQERIKEGIGTILKDKLHKLPDFQMEPKISKG